MLHVQYFMNKSRIRKIQCPTLIYCLAGLDEEEWTCKVHVLRKLTDF